VKQFTFTEERWVVWSSVRGRRPLEHWSVASQVYDQRFTQINSHFPQLLLEDRRKQQNAFNEIDQSDNLGLSEGVVCSNGSLINHTYCF
jgi:hypothetical protein